VQRIVVLNLSKATKGNATGVGLADVTTDKVVTALNPKTTWINCITSGVTASEPLLPEIAGHPQLEVTGEAAPMPFDDMVPFFSPDPQERPFPLTRDA
jgi:hypothetical protein